MLGKKSQLIDEKLSPSVPTSQYVNAVYARLQKMPDVLALPEGAEKQMTEEELQRRLVEEMSDFDKRERLIRELNELVRERRESKELLSEVLKAHDEPKVDFATKEEDDEWDEIEHAYMEGKIDEPTYLRRLNELSEKRKRKSFVEKSLFGDSEENPVDYIDRSVRSEREHSFDDFWKGVKSLAWHPLEEMDKDWLSYQKAAKVEPKLSPDRVERSMERGAALLGRVVTMSNVEPLIDHEEGKNMREALIDIEFGRRSD